MPHPAFTVLALAATLAARPTKLPDTPAGRAAARWIAVYNRGDLAALRAFADSAWDPAALARRPAEMLARRDAWRFLNLGRMEVVRVERSSDTSVVARIRQPFAGSRGTLEVHVSAAAPHRLTMVEWTRHEVPERERGTPASVHRAPRLSPDQVADTVDALARRLASAGVFSGTVVVTRHGQPLLRRAYGLADEGSRVADAVDTRYELASVGKLFAATAIAQLVERGKLSFDDTLSRLLPGWPNADAARRITVAQLLTHTSGLPDYFRNPAWESAKDTISGLAGNFPFFAADSLQFAPGTRWDYSNSNFLVLGMIVERVSGEPYASYLARHVFGPAGMTAAWSDSAAGRRAVPYSYYGPGRALEPERRRAVPLAAHAWGSPAGGGYASADDMARFGDALLGGRLVRPATRDAMFAGHAPGPGPDALAAYGFDSMERTAAGRVLSKSGYGYGAFSQVELYPDAGVTVVVLSNVDTWGTETLCARLRELVGRM